ncbi:RNA/RNP complex-1-interacting phosphatase-like [Symphorus nematophorus]
MLQDKNKKKKKKKKSRGVPDRWLDYSPVGQRVPGTRFVAFKVPLKPSLNCRVPDSDSFSIWDLLDHLQSQDLDLGLIIDLTFTDRYYDLRDVPESVSYIKIQTKGHHVPSDATVLRFTRAVRHFLSENRDNEQLIGIHCTHGLNRTGYLVCRYLIDVDGLEAAAAVDLFNSSRGHRIERGNYLRDLQRGAKRSNTAIDQDWEEPVRGLATERPPKTERPPETERLLKTERALLQDERPPRKERQPLQDKRPPETERLPRKEGPPKTERPPETEGPLQTAGAETSPQTATATEETRWSGDHAADKTQPADGERRPGNRRRRGGRRRRLPPPSSPTSGAPPLTLQPRPLSSLATAGAASRATGSERTRRTNLRDTN